MREGGSNDKVPVPTLTYPEACEMARSRVANLQGVREHDAPELHLLWSLVLAELEAHSFRVQQGFLEKTFEDPERCGGCWKHWPCPTVSRILAALEGLR